MKDKNREHRIEASLQSTMNSDALSSHKNYIPMCLCGLI